MLIPPPYRQIVSFISQIDTIHQVVQILMGKVCNNGSMKMDYLDSQIGKYLDHFPAYFDDEHVKGVHTFHALMKRGRSGSIPPANIYKNQNRVEIVMPVPNKQKDDFSLFIQGPHITLICEEDEKTPENETEVVREFDYRKFSRVFRLPFSVEAEAVAFSYESGALTISIQIPETHEQK